MGGEGLPKIPIRFYHLLIRVLPFDNQKEDSMQMLKNGFLLTLMHNKLTVNFTTDYSYNDTLLGSVKETKTLGRTGVAMLMWHVIVHWQ